MDQFDLSEYLSGNTIVKVDYKGRIMRHHFHELDTETDLAFQKRVGRIDAAKFRQGVPAPTDEALQAELWLYDKLCEKVEVVVDGNMVDVADFKFKLSPRVKRIALKAFQASSREAEPDEKN